MNSGDIWEDMVTRESFKVLCLGKTVWESVDIVCVLVHSQRRFPFPLISPLWKSGSWTRSSSPQWRSRWRKLSVRYTVYIQKQLLSMMEAGALCWLISACTEYHVQHFFFFCLTKTILSLSRILNKNTFTFKFLSPDWGVCQNYITRVV